MIKEFFKKLDTKAGLLQRFAFRNDNMRKKIAFTLAEILITIAIIGIVAALTIPVMLHVKERHTTLTRLKKTYSDLSQAIRLAEGEYGTGFSMCDYDVCTFEQEKSKASFNKYLRPHLKIIKEYNNNDCNKLYTIYSKTNLVYNASNTACYQLANGTAITYSIGIRPSFEKQSYSISFSIFPNPNKKKKLIGRDAFALNLINEDNGYYVGTAVRQRDKNLTRAQLISYCSAGNNNINVNIGGQNVPITAPCTELIIRDGFKFAPDYPIKF